MRKDRSLRALAPAIGLCLLVLVIALSVLAQTAPRYRFDPDWPKTMPNKWKIGGVTGLAVDKDDNVWVLNRPNDLRDMELRAETNTVDCCVRPPSMIHINKNGDVIGSFDPPQGHGMAVDSQGFVYVGNSVRGLDTVRKYDPKTGQMLKEIPRAPEAQGGGGGGDAAPVNRAPGRGGPGPTGTFPQQGGGRGGANPEAQAAAAAAQAAFRAKYPPTSPMIVGGVEEIRLESARGYTSRTAIWAGA
jgi:hypothetical protein